MALGNYSGIKTNYCSLDTKNAKVKHRQKIDGQVVENSYNFLEGTLIDIQNTEWEFEGNIIPQVKLILNEDGENYSLEFNRNSAFGRDVLNRLVNIPSIGFIRITPYQSDFNGKMYTHGAIRHNDIKIEQKFKKGEYPEIEIETLKSGKEVTDSTARDNFFADLVGQIKKQITHKVAVVESELSKADFDAPERDEIAF